MVVVFEMRVFRKSNIRLIKLEYNSPTQYVGFFFNTSVNQYSIMLALRDFPFNEISKKCPRDVHEKCMRFASGQTNFLFVFISLVFASKLAECQRRYFQFVSSSICKFRRRLYPYYIADCFSCRPACRALPFHRENLDNLVCGAPSFS